MNIAYEGNLSEVEFIECFNESLLFKSKNKPLKTHDILTDKVKYIQEFKCPEAFIFIYEKDLLISLSNGRVYFWSVDGTLITE